MRASPNAKKPCRSGMAFCWIFIAGDHLISHTVARAVPSAQRGLTSVFGMGTGDPSQYGHRQIVRDVIRDPSLAIRISAQSLRLEYVSTYDGAWRVVARSLSAASSLSRMVSPGPSRNADCNLAPKKFARVELNCNEIDWFIQGLYRRASAYCAELILWTSRTGD